MIIDLRSDTITRPTPAMLEAMCRAAVGDDVFEEDPTVKALEEKAAAMFGMEAGLFFPSGTMANQVAVKIHTQPMDEVIADQLCHIYNHENGGAAFHSGVSMRLTACQRGIMTPEAIEACILPETDWYPTTRLVCIENSVNKGGGAVYSIDAMWKVADCCRSHRLALHLDGARIFNALTFLQQQPIALKGMFDTISVCISKGLGAPAGSVLLGSAPLMKRARKVRKAMGGGMRQVGILAAACIYALDNHIQRLEDDHRRAATIARWLEPLDWVKQVLPVETNIVVMEVEHSNEAAARLGDKGIRASVFSPTQLRMVTHLDFTEEQLEELGRRLKS
ncbi:MAG: GntG family PLP-dependent aldolase [Chitinophagales bacterium]